MNIEIYNNKNNMYKFINWIVYSTKNLWGLNWEAKIGILFLIPHVIGVIIFLIELFNNGLDLQYFSEVWNCIYRGNDIATPAIPFYLGLMAIAGAYLIKGNLKIKE